LGYITFPATCMFCVCIYIACIIWLWDSILSTFGLQYEQLILHFKSKTLCYTEANTSLQLLWRSGYTNISWFYVTMAWCNSGSRNMNSYAKRGYDRIGSFKALVSHESKSPRWRLLWRKIVKEKRKIFDCSSSAQANITYDPYTYSQNFDHGLIMSNPDDSSRSFSARFAVPSRIFEKGGLV